jgi:hypothetical protein
MWSEQAIAAKMGRIQSRRLYPEDEQWIKSMLALAKRQREGESVMSPEEILAHNERVKRDFMEGKRYAGEEGEEEG